ncbi:MAG: hypothetical protein GY788_11735 [bacterium]|nr:hypothetical protein [bacterium]
MHGLVAHKNGVFTLNLEQLVVALAIGSDPDTGKRHAVLTGDHWLALARTRAEEGDRIRALSELPVGIRHRYCVLGECSDDGMSFKGLASADKRRLDFPTLSCLDAGDIGYDPDQCDYAESENVADVKEALDVFCKRLQPPYHALRMSQGTGQEGGLGDILPGPIEVIVEDQDGAPVKGVDVIFTTLQPVQGTQTVDRLFENPPNSPRRAVTVETGQDGRARAFWQLNATAGLHTVEATLKNPVDGRPTASVVFAAMAHAAEKETQFPVVEDVMWANGSPFENDTVAPIAGVIAGLQIVFSEPIIRPLASADTVILTAEVPSRVSVNNRQAFVFYQQIICGSVVPSDARVVHFKPDPGGIAAIFQLLSQQEIEWDQLPECAPAEGVRFRIRVVGRFTLSERGQVADAFVPGVPDPTGQRIALDLGRPGLGHASDFEAWFYLNPKQNRPDDERVDLNKATMAELQTLPGIGQTLAKRIIEGRNAGSYSKVSNLVDRGILTRSQLDAIAKRVRV